MKLVTYAEAGGPRLGVRDGADVVDATVLLGESETVRDVQALLCLPGDGLGRLTARVAEGGLATAPRISAPELLPPVLQPPTVRDHIAYEEHATRNFTREIAEVWRRRPIHYYSNPSRLFGSGATVPLPATERLDYELEIAVVVGRECSDLSLDDALDCVAGFTVLNDWSARDLQADEMAYGLGPAKGKDFATSLGPCMVTLDEIRPHLATGTLDAACTVRVNGETWAESNAVGMFHTWAAMLKHASQDSRLMPGDVIAGGTVGRCSIGEALRLGVPARYLRPGDEVELEVEHIGILANRIGPAGGLPAEHKYWAAALPPMPQPPCKEEA